jgi:hypothetical protein
MTLSTGRSRYAATELLNTASARRLRSMELLPL